MPQKWDKQAQKVAKTKFGAKSEKFSGSSEDLVKGGRLA
jgi:hypothetical protein